MHRMKILWLEVTEPSTYVSRKHPIGGWQDSLERIVRTIPEIELVVAFMSEKHSEVKKIDNVTYVPIYAKWSLKEKIFDKYWNVYVEKMLPKVKLIVEEYTPSLIHIFGTEWPFGQIAYHTKIPVVIHIMGAIVPYNNAYYPPGYSYRYLQCVFLWNPIKLFKLWRERRNRKNREEWERSTWNGVENYMGRTQWDCSLSRVMHPGRRYFHVEEALRTVFLSGNHMWKMPNDQKLHLISTGCGTFWKGPDMMLKVARILMSLGVDFEWILVGSMDDTIRRVVQKKEGISYKKCNIDILGFRQPDELLDLLCNSTLYVHTAYIENSPNSICEAQCLGVPVVSTNVGGAASLVRHNIDGVLVAANDPWQMADAIVELFNDKERMRRYSDNSRSFAIYRHNDEHIKDQLLECYHSFF